MLTPTIQGPARTRIAARTTTEQAELDRRRANGTLVVDDARRRPLYFDGRFLAARDLTREQDYMLRRQADLARAGGAGVVTGLEVTVREGGAVIGIAPGHGVTPTGEAVVLPRALSLRLTDLPEAQMLDAAFGILKRPVEPPTTRTGLYLVALRPVEFSDNLVASYPTSVGGTRTVEDGDVVEAVAVTLIPFPDPTGDADVSRRRARVARTIFVDGSRGGAPEAAVPLAMVALQNNRVTWVDVDMVRRDAGADHADRLGLGIAPRGLREAYLRQHDDHLLSVVAERAATNRPRRFAASDHFLALPPGGRMPAAAINTADFTQSYFPADVTVDLSIVAEDEVALLLEESLRLPPIDLTLSGEALGSTAVLVLIPVPAARVRPLRATLERVTRTLRTAAPGLVASRKPLESLRILRRPLLLPGSVLDPSAAPDRAWATEVAAASSTANGLLWYVRRRNVDYRSDLVGTTVAVPQNELMAEADTTARLKTLGLDKTVSKLQTKASVFARAEVVSLLSSAKLATPLLTRAAVQELTDKAGTGSSKTPTLARASVLDVTARYADPQLGEGMKRLEAAEPELLKSDAFTAAVVEGGQAPELDRAARLLADDQLPAFTKALAAAGTDKAQVRSIITEALKRVKG